MKNELKVFENNNIRSIYNEEQEKWYFSVEDIVRILTDSVNPKDYIKKLRKRDSELSEGWGQIVTPLKMETAGGRVPTNRNSFIQCKITVISLFWKYLQLYPLLRIKQPLLKVPSYSFLL